MLVAAYGLAIVLGSAGPGAPLLLHWIWGLAHNRVTEAAHTALPIGALLHVVFGIEWATLYARLVEPRLSGPGGRRGILFAPMPCALSLVVFLLAVGGGVLGLGLGAGPLPVVGNLALHLVYGASLGYLYSTESQHTLVARGEMESPEDAWILANAQSTSALGIVVGLGLGGAAGLVGELTFAPDQASLVALLVGAVAGSEMGALIGSFFGLSPHVS
jgi:hypothetical protein